MLNALHMLRDRAIQSWLEYRALLGTSSYLVLLMSRVLSPIITSLFYIFLLSTMRPDRNIVEVWATNSMIVLTYPLIHTASTALVRDKQWGVISHINIAGKLKISLLISKMAYIYAEAFVMAAITVAIGCFLLRGSLSTTTVVGIVCIYAIVAFCLCSFGALLAAISLRMTDRLLFTNAVWHATTILSGAIIPSKELLGDYSWITQALPLGLGVKFVTDFLSGVDLYHVLVELVPIALLMTTAFAIASMFTMKAMVVSVQRRGTFGG